jgi:hypothetical protein
VGPEGNGCLLLLLLLHGVVGALVGVSGEAPHLLLLLLLVVQHVAALQLCTSPELVLAAHA